MRKIILFAGILLFLQSCLVSKPKKFTLLYDGQNTGLDKLIKINGAYYNPKENMAFLFYSDGIFINSGVLSEEHIQSSFSKGSGWDNDKGNASIYGRYIVRGDTIIGQEIDKTFTDKGKVYTYRFIILSENKIKSVRTNQILYFVPIENRMDSTNWMFKKDWFYKK